MSIENKVLGIIFSVFDAYSVTLFLPDETGQTYRLAAAHSLGDDIPADLAITPGKGLAGSILTSHSPMHIPNFDPRVHTLGYYDAETEKQIKAFMGFPIPSGGVLCVDSKRQYSFSEKDYKILQLFADLIARQQSLSGGNMAGAIPRYFAELGVIQDLRFRYHRWPVFLKNFLRSISAATEFEYCAFATLQENGDYYTLESESVPLLLGGGEAIRLPLGSGLVGWVFQNEQPIYAEEGGLSPASALFGKLQDIPDFPAAICMPVMVNKSCRGVLCLANTEPKGVEDSLRSFVRQAVDHLSLFLENLYLKNRLHMLMPPAKVKRDGARIYDPDTAPHPRSHKDD